MLYHKRSDEQTSPDTLDLRWAATLGSNFDKIYVVVREQLDLVQWSPRFTTTRLAQVQVSTKTSFAILFPTTSWHLICLGWCGLHAHVWWALVPSCRLGRTPTARPVWGAILNKSLKLLSRHGCALNLFPLVQFKCSSIPPTQLPIFICNAHPN